MKNEISRRISIDSEFTGYFVLSVFYKSKIILGLNRNFIIIEIYNILVY